MKNRHFFHFFQKNCIKNQDISPRYAVQCKKLIKNLPGAVKMSYETIPNH